MFLNRTSANVLQDLSKIIADIEEYPDNQPADRVPTVNLEDLAEDSSDPLLAESSSPPEQPLSAATITGPNVQNQNRAQAQRLAVQRSLETETA